MRAKVIKDFIDKETKTLHKNNTEIEITGKRLSEINSTSYGIFVEEIKEPIKETKSK